jgi:hypothetical protein
MNTVSFPFNDSLSVEKKCNFCLQVWLIGTIASLLKKVYGCTPAKGHTQEGYGGGSQLSLDNIEPLSVYS